MTTRAFPFHACSLRAVRRVATTAGLAAGLSIMPTIAYADAIDGDWCLASRQMRIEGPKITTPGGNAITGDYTRHTFSYVVPVREPGAGSNIDMQLISDDAVEVRTGAAAAETWRRCKPIS